MFLNSNFYLISKIDFLSLYSYYKTMTTRIDKVVTRSMTREISARMDEELFIAFHRSSPDPISWSPVFHYRKHCELYPDDDDEYHQPCKCCLALLFRKENRTNQYNIACRTCFNWKGPIPYSAECCD